MTSDNSSKGAVDDFAKGSRDIASETADTVRHHASQASEGAQGFAETASDTAADLYGRAKDRVSGAAEQLPGSAKAALEAGRDAYDKGSDRVLQQVSKQPIEALLLAGALGYLIGWATSRS